MVVAAVPAELDALVAGWAELDDELSAAAARLAGSLNRLRIAVSEIPLPRTDADTALRRHLEHWRAVEEPVSALADGLIRADVGALEGMYGLLGWLPTPAGWLESAFPALAARRGEVGAAAVEAYTTGRLSEGAGDLPDARASREEIARFVATLTDAEVMTVARLVRHRVGEADLSDRDRAYLSDAFSPLVARLSRSACGPDQPRDLPALIADLRAPGQERQESSFLGGVWDGLTKGDLSDGFDNVAGELGRNIGQLVSSIAVYGDVRDAGVAAGRGDWGGVAFAGVGLIPGLGDLARGIKGGKNVHRVVDVGAQTIRYFDDAAVGRLFRQLPLPERLPQPSNLARHGIDDADMAHILQRHSFEYFLREVPNKEWKLVKNVKRSNTFFAPHMSASEIASMLGRALDEAERIGGPIRDGQRYLVEVDGVLLRLRVEHRGGLRRVVQFFPDASSPSALHLSGVDVDALLP